MCLIPKAKINLSKVVCLAFSIAFISFKIDFCWKDFSLEISSILVASLKISGIDLIKFWSQKSSIFFSPKSLISKPSFEQK
ncbi:Uncharacterised protein [Chlamydia trachomatis]|nr:Uncharacterised protein [Chlamydia trachomatis]